MLDDLEALLYGCPPKVIVDKGKLTFLHTSAKHFDPVESVVTDVSDIPEQNKKADNDN